MQDRLIVFSCISSCSGVGMRRAQLPRLSLGYTAHRLSLKGFARNGTLLRILVVEDYAPLRMAIAEGLREDGHSVDAASDGQEGLHRASTCDYDVLLLDIQLPEVSGLDILKSVREAEKPCQVLILTARDSVEDRVAGLDLGADDYLSKPFAMEELLARVRALLRRRYGMSTPVISVGHLQVDTARHTVTTNGEEAELTAREYALLEYLILRVGQVVSRTEIWEHIYDEHSDATSNVVDVYVGYLRKKLERPECGQLIRTRRGEGYVLADPNA
jgi:DNA-binding response OmpR family regulator